MINAKLETIERHGWPWKLMIGTGHPGPGRDGWYEWKALDSRPKPVKAALLHIHGDAPLLFAGLERVAPRCRAGRGPRLCHRHERRPWAAWSTCTTGAQWRCRPELAREWVDPATPVARAMRSYAPACQKRPFVVPSPAGSRIQ